MEIGVATSPTHDSIGPAQVAQLAEEHGYESLFFTDHSHIPASWETPYAGRVPYRANTCTPTTCSSLSRRPPW